MLYKIIFICRYYKNSISQEEGWNKEVILWCKKEAERKILNPKIIGVDSFSTK